MKTLLVVAALLLSSGLSGVLAQSDPGLFSRTFGDPAHPALIFLHGGPGYNSVNFELSTAQVLADRGYFVVVFDQRGCGRSKDMTDNQFTLDEAIGDLMEIYQTYEIRSATLLGHSWGGTLGGFFAERHPEMVENLVLIGSPLSYQMTLRTILARCRDFYAGKADSVNLGYIAAIEKMDTASLEYSSYLFYHAMQCGLYIPSQVTTEARSLYRSMASQPDAGLLAKSEFAPVSGLYKSEAYTTLDMRSVFARCAENGVNLWGIYGEDDGLFDDVQLKVLKDVIGEKHCTVVENASHNVFIDQQKFFLDALERAVPSSAGGK